MGSGRKQTMQALWHSHACTKSPWGLTLDSLGSGMMHACQMTRLHLGSTADLQRSGLFATGILGRLFVTQTTRIHLVLWVLMVLVMVAILHAVTLILLAW